MIKTRIPHARTHIRFIISREYRKIRFAYVTMPSPKAAEAKPSAKRKNDSISPPPLLKRKAQSSISKNAVANFFTPTSQKSKERTNWSERAPDDDTPATLLVARYKPENAEGPEQRRRRKIAAFDLDSTLITTASGKTHANDPNDWKWWDSSVPTKLRQLYTEDDYRVVILSNQAGLTLHPDPKSKAPKNLGKDRLANFKQKCSAVLTKLDLPTAIYAATGKDIYRKPRPGMWRALCEDYNISEADVDLENSIFVGDAGGRTAQLKKGESGSATVKDFSCSDRNFAHNVGITYKTPEEFFLCEKPREFTRDFDLANHPYPEHGEDGTGDIIFEKKTKQEIVLFCGPPGGGKSTFYWKYLKPLGYERVNQDTLKTRAKCFKATGDLLNGGHSVAIDNTNPDPDGRAEWIKFAEKHKVPIRCVWFKASQELCEHNAAVRALNKPLNPEAREALPKIAFSGFFSRFKEPKVKEGFGDVVEVEFKFRGTEAEYAIWGRYWN
ncbi:polynucleotide kinase 3 phosphatase-domain-containing protein [Pseudomassariella vexata]|uniref:Polynucleotide kinase 3 phosphatase-domain-containing protein n=1 Tax=Pseudomassariella vexata TaxID=1141098 RepID=A0A1Y2DYV2_9PEZI|nr:polynucleotide kinase 3 phosphatase-domain-containing protein [Pseudomassariella vexata]ORY64488.1 polynucleotide kinase 3 phosphatase-domain-containing protein [Pseudomassariella vexata]